MCHQVTCEVCGRPTWEGCGDHIEEAIGHVPPAERCQCDPETRLNATPRIPLTGEACSLPGR